MMPPHTAEAYLETTTGFACVSDSAVVWKFSSGEFPDNVKFHAIKTWTETMNWVEVINVQYDNAGTYKCQGEDKDHIVFIAEGNLVVLGK